MLASRHFQSRAACLRQAFTGFVHILCAFPLFFAACGSAPSIERAPTYEDLVRARIEQTRSQSGFAIRHNPADCACSPFEILVGPREPEMGDRRVRATWHRVELVGLDDNDPIVSRIREHLARVDASGQADRRHFLMEGRLESRVGTCARGTALLSFAPSALLDDEKAPMSGSQRSR